MTLVLLLHAGCVHGSGNFQAEPSGRACNTGGQSSASVRINLLIAEGQYAEAETLLLNAIDCGLLAAEVASQLRARLHHLAARETEAKESSSRQPICRSEHPDHPVCQELPEEYSYHSTRQALEAMSSTLKEKSLALHNPDRTQKGPCPRLGVHYNVRRGGQRAGSIVCCPCCVDTGSGPLTWMKCRIVW
jgi:hypothetical protein